MVRPPFECQLEAESLVTLPIRFQLQTVPCVKARFFSTGAGARFAQSRNGGRDPRGDLAGNATIAPFQHKT